MSEENLIKPLKSFTVKTEEEVVNRFKNLKDQLGITTDGQMLSTLIDRFEQPQRVNDRTRELTEKMDNYQRLLTESNQECDRQKEQIAALEHQLAEANGTANANAEAAAAQQLAFQKQLDELKPGENQRVVSFTPDNLKVLEYVAARESKRRRQEWSISHIINFFIYARFIKGMLNGDLGSVSDSELKNIGINLKIKAKEAVEI